MATQAFLEAFKVPKEAFGVVDQMVDDAEQVLVPLLAGGPFTAAEATEAFSKALGRAVSPEEAAKRLREEYRRGVVNLVDEETARYALADFYIRLDVFSVTETELYHSFPKKTRDELNRLYLARYVGGLDRMADTPTLDEVIPLEEIVARIEGDERQLYLSPCDCRCLAGDCEKPTMTCLSYRTVPGSYASRGISKPVSREEAVQVMRSADAAGLMHTANPYGGICNCCSDCCYLFRAQREIGSESRWPLVRYRAVLSGVECIQCGLCTERCPFGLFTLADEKPDFEEDRCVGCGLCVNTCPTAALSLRALSPEEGGGHA